MITVKPDDKNSMYLSDGAYVTAETDGTVTVWCERENGKHFVNLDSTALRLLHVFAVRRGHIP